MTASLDPVAHLQAAVHCTDIAEDVELVMDDVLDVVLRERCERSAVGGAHLTRVQGTIAGRANPRGDVAVQIGQKIDRGAEEMPVAEERRLGADRQPRGRKYEPELQRQIVDRDVW